MPGLISLPHLRTSLVVCGCFVSVTKGVALSGVSFRRGFADGDAQSLVPPFDALGELLETSGAATKLKYLCGLQTPYGESVKRVLPSRTIMYLSILCRASVRLGEQALRLVIKSIWRVEN